MPSNVFSERGSEIHRILALYINALATQRKRTDYELFDTLMAAATGDAREILEHLRETLVVDPEKVLGTELYLALDEDFVPVDILIGSLDLPVSTEEIRQVGPAYEGTPDFIQFHSETEAEIQDWKSYFQVIEPETFQSKLYPLMLFCYYPGLEKVTFRLEFVRYGIGREVVWTRDQVPMLKKLARAERARQMAMHQGAAQGLDALAMPGSHCVYCPLLRARKCPLGEANPFEMSPEDRLRWQIYLVQASKENLALLKEHINAAGPITITDDNQEKYTAGFQLKRKERFPLLTTVAELTKWTAATDERLMDKLFVGSTELKPYLKAKKRAVLAEAMVPVKVATEVSEFRVGKAVDPNEED